ncbi:MAG: hypothetical protein EOP07_06385 [Proteobacteria bacterium]|nr:MAG: hypothetical protein EOP07_06385 [Pseudomonadota bacterium]
MKKLTSEELELLNFDNSDVSEMTVDSTNKSFVIRVVGADLNVGEDDERLENVTILVKDFDSVQARIFNDDTFQSVDAADSAFFLTEVCELTHEDGKTMISGFSTQEGSWADYTITGGTFELSSQA